MTDEISVPLADEANLERMARSFWSWFLRCESQLRTRWPESSCLRELDEQLAELGIGAWEIGPAVASSAKYSFTLSPNGDPDLYAKTRRIVGLAPSLSDWEFLSAKPRKQWNRKFQWSERQVPIDCSDWRFVVYRYEDGLSEVVLIGAALAPFEPEEQMRILMFVLISELG